MIKQEQIVDRTDCTQSYLFSFFFFFFFLIISFNIVKQDQIVDRADFRQSYLFSFFFFFFIIISCNRVKQEQIVEVILQKLFFNEYRSNSYFNYSIIRSHGVNEIQGE